MFVCMCVCTRARTREEQVKMFWQQADFGYVDERLNEMTVLCEPQNSVRHSAFDSDNRSSRDVLNGFFKFGSVLRKTAGSVRFRFWF